MQREKRELVDCGRVWWPRACRAVAGLSSHYHTVGRVVARVEVTQPYSLRRPFLSASPTWPTAAEHEENRVTLPEMSETTVGVILCVFVVGFLAFVFLSQRRK